MDRSRVKRLRRVQPLLDLDADDPCVAADIEVLVLDVSQSVGEVQHGAIGKFDVKLLIVEVDVKLGYVGQREKEKAHHLSSSVSQVSVNFIQQKGERTTTVCKKE